MKTFIPTVFILFSLAFLSLNTYGQNNESVWFITKWKTDNPGSSNSTSITIPTGPGATYNYNVDWNNDGVADQIGITGSVTHDFINSGTYFIRISGVFPRIFFNYGGDSNKLLEVNQWGTGLWSSMAFAFAGCENMNINANDAPNLSMATNMESMFRDATNLNADLSAWNVSTITNMASLFNYATNFNGALYTWNTSQVTRMLDMFASASNFNQPIGNWNVSNVTNMYGMFFSASRFNQPISSWNVANVTDMGNMFSYASSFNQPIGNWNVSNVTNMPAMFSNATSFNQPIGTWSVGKVNNMTAMFSNATSFNQPIGNWNVTNVQNMFGMFQKAISFNQPIGNWNVAKVDNMSGMFYEANSFNQPISNWNVGNVTILSAMFYKATSFNQGIGNWNIAKVNNMSQMFDGATNFNQQLATWNISFVTTMNDIFHNSGLSTYNYDITLIIWDALGAFNKQLGNTSPLKYCAATIQRANLINKGWMIFGDAPAQNELYSTNSGAWNNANTWCYQRVPLATDVVYINPGHIISVPTGTFPVKNIVNNGTVSFDLGGQIQLNQ
jgi:surface protein